MKLGLSHKETKSHAEGLLEKGTKEDIWDWEGGRDRKLRKSCNKKLHDWYSSDINQVIN